MGVSAVARTQIPQPALERLLALLDAKQREYGAGEGYGYAEAFKVLAPGQLHCNVDSWRM